MHRKPFALLFALVLALATADSSSDETCLKKRNAQMDHALLQGRAHMKIEKSGTEQCAGAKDEADIAKTWVAEAKKRRQQQHDADDANKRHEEKTMGKQRKEDAEQKLKDVEHTRKMSEKARQDHKDAKMKEMKYHEAVGQHARKIGKKRGASIKKTGRVLSGTASAFKNLAEPDPEVEHEPEPHPDVAPQPSPWVAPVEPEPSPVAPQPSPWVAPVEPEPYAPEPSPPPPVTYCTSDEHFTADLVLNAWCESWEFPVPLELCESLSDCWPYPNWEDPEEHMCSCQGHEQCKEINGKWVTNTCQDELQWTVSPEIEAVLEQAVAAESCDDLTVPWGDWPIVVHITWPASQCCDNFPATVCDPDARVMSPCASDEDEDWMSETYMHGWCEFATYPAKGRCDWEPGCWTWDMGDGNWGCGCGEYASCNALDGTFSGTTCGDNALTWDAGGHGLKAAAEAGTCQDITTSWGSDLTQELKWQAEKCCASYPKTACEPDAEVMTPCASSDDFLPDALMSGWCSFFEHPSQERCTQQGCNSYEMTNSEGDPVWECTCNQDQEAACTNLGGRFQKSTCLDEAKDWDNAGQGLREAAEKGTCEEVTTSSGEDLGQAVVWRAERCCASFPKTACDPDAKIMTPCAHDDDFLPDAAMDSWCSFNTQPSQSACQQKGCYWNDHGNGYADCSCDEEAACTELGGSFYSQSCRHEAMHWDNRGEGLKAAEAQGNCEGVTTGWGSDLTDELRGRASKCCATFPATACAKDKVLQHPCSSDDEFEPDSIVNSGCDYHGNEPHHEVCEDEGFCSCQRQDACNHFNGTWNEDSCREHFLHWDDGGVGLEAVRAAAGQCADVTTSWGEDIATAVVHQARKCCANFPTFICGTVEA